MTDTQHSPLLPELTDIWQQTLSWQPNEVQQKTFQRLYEGILAGNRQLNLTRITAPEEFWEKHLWDSLRGVAPLLQSSSFFQTMIDIGTGAGFPGFPVAIALPQSSVTLLDSTRKKINILDTLISQLNLENATTLVGRAEAIGQQPQHRQTYDIALVRAVGSASVCAEYALPLLEVGGLAILYRGHWTQAETETLKPALEQLGGAIEAIEPFTTPLTQSIRHCIYLRLISPTPAQFPRGVGIPAQQPL
ncbi:MULTISPECIES: 16S rRNA (guanine(527)-N(7))-methyltransferase RsmG [unclassified Coleofasciculus]|uniref:16S rRNA (guanine(527)-N(7))-methyltransferase RsmG n=1 Tax=unclassified Coleofasciculus TaxID=2692782 RepID=UPI00188134D9|nr:MULTISPECIES: 16S rRNA (guanine(527)-N(7))-methyltransferase RsmG [unclassified Coleofasciculus]MBE9128393.1 16S rRNA (guanine(527)-N(7))-methyltransferase RsmG [Coleofasciculus sp. LEGE 07081]MBE9147913.1 16S rRNA (guanine(527)-N(7))-methyltransferase RsmG [Coleofasciculus sp. LEGE 07092]